MQEKKSVWKILEALKYSRQGFKNFSFFYEHKSIVKIETRNQAHRFLIRNEKT